MSRFRVATFGHAFGRWLPTRELAFQDAVERLEATRDPFDGRVWLNLGTTIEEDDGLAPAGETILAWGAALLFLRENREHAERLAEENRKDATDDRDRDRWRGIASKVRAVMADARRRREAESA